MKVRTTTWNVHIVHAQCHYKGDQKTPKAQNHKTSPCDIYGSPVIREALALGHKCHTKCRRCCLVSPPTPLPAPAITALPRPLVPTPKPIQRAPPIPEGQGGLGGGWVLVSPRKQSEPCLQAAQALRGPVWGGWGTRSIYSPGGPIPLHTW